MLRYLREYTLAKYKKEDLPLEQINYEYVDGLYTFLQTAHNCHHNGAITIMRCLRTFMLFCIRNEWVEKTPFQHFKLHEEKNKEKAHLTKDELDTIIRKPLNNARLERVRDVFAFCCLTGWHSVMRQIYARSIFQRMAKAYFTKIKYIRENGT